MFYYKVSNKKSVQRDFATLPENTRTAVFFWLQGRATACNFIKRETPVQTFYFSFCEILHKGFIAEERGMEKPFDEEKHAASSHHTWEHFPLDCKCSTIIVSKISYNYKNCLSVFTCSRLTIETQAQGVKYIQS